MSESIHVDFNALAAGAESIQSTFQALQGSLQDLESQLQPMVSSWSGTARDAYAAQKQTWEQASDEMAQLLQRMGQAVSQARENYTQTESGNTSTWG